jgi:hypothetical protein
MRVFHVSGQGVRIAVIDTGVNARHPHIFAPTRCVAFDPEDTNPSCEDTLGHGTAVTAAIQEKAPHAEYYILKLFGNSLRTTTSRLIRAIEWTIENRMDVVNLSLGSSNMASRDALQSLVARAGQAGMVLVSARHSAQVPVLPGALEGVIGVDVDWDLPRDCYRISEANGARCCFASGFPRPLPGVPPARNLNGISFAVANMSGFVARACQGLERRSIDRVLEVLTAETAKPVS